jgi:hypothetical protein
MRILTNNYQYCESLNLGLNNDAKALGAAHPLPYSSSPPLV